MSSAISQPKVVDPAILEILKLLNGKTFKQASALLYETQEYIETMAKLKTLNTSVLIADLEKFNGDD